LQADGEDCLAFRRDSRADGQSCIVVLNFSDREHVLALGPEESQARLVFSNRARGNPTDDLSGVGIAPFEVYIAEI
jgi:hypothetical protein